MATIDLTYQECLDLLRSERVGRIGVIVEDQPLIFPVNYRVIEDIDGATIPRLVWVALRTRAGNVIDRSPMFVAFEIDHFDHAQRLGWSVLLSGTLQPVDDAAAEFAGRFDPGPWLDDRDRWLAIEPTRVTGRRIVGDDAEWAFSTAAYL